MNIETLSPVETTLLDSLNQRALSIIKVESELQRYNVKVDPLILYNMNLDQLKGISKFLN